MQVLTTLQTKQVSAAYLYYHGCCYEVPSWGVSKNSFTQIEIFYQYIIDNENCLTDDMVNRKMTQMFNAGVSFAEFESYCDNMNYAHVLWCAA
jgi:hypothetical protein